MKMMQLTQTPHAILEQERDRPEVCVRRDARRVGKVVPRHGRVVRQPQLVGLVGMQLPQRLRGQPQTNGDGLEDG